MEKSDAPGQRMFSGLRLRQVREKRGLSRQQLAEKTDPPLSRAYIYLLEGAGEDDGARRPSYDVVVRLAKALDVLPEAFSGEPETSGVHQASDIKIPPALRDAVERFKIPDGDLEELARFTFRGRRPQSASDWAHLWTAILSSVGLELR